MFETTWLRAVLQQMGTLVSGEELAQDLELVKPYQAGLSPAKTVPSNAVVLNLLNAVTLLYGSSCCDDPSPQP